MAGYSGKWSPTVRKAVNAAKRAHAERYAKERDPEAYAQAQAEQEEADRVVRDVYEDPRWRL